MRRLVTGLVVAAVALLVPQAASAASDLYVQPGGAGPLCIAAAPCSSLPLAISLSTGAATIHVTGPLTITGALPFSPFPLTIVGTGATPADTVIQAAGSTLNLESGQTLENVEVKSDQSAVGVVPGATVRSVIVQTTSATDPAILLGGGAPGSAAVITDSKILGSSGVADSSGAFLSSLDVERSTIDSTVSGISISTATATVSDSVIHLTGSGGTAATASGSPFAGTINLVQDTLDGIDSPGSKGVLAGSGALAGGNVRVTATAIRGFATDLTAQAGQPAAISGGAISIDHSDFGTKVAEAGTPASGPFLGTPAGTITTGTANINADPGFINRAAGDYRLRADSALRGAGGNAPLGTIPAVGSVPPASGLGESANDLAGNPVVPSSRDIGALQYQSVLPVAALQIPSNVIAGRPATFSAAGSTYSLGPIADYRWDLDGTGRYLTDTGSSPQLTNTFPSPGAVPVGVEVVGFDGATATVIRAVTVGLPTALTPAGPPGIQAPVPPAGSVAGFAAGTGTFTIGPNGQLNATLSCPATASSYCKGKLDFLTAGRYARVESAANRRKKSRSKAIDLANGAFSLAPGHSVTVHLRLSRAALALLAKLKTLTAVETATIVDAAGHQQKIQHTVTLKYAKPRGHAKH